MIDDETIDETISEFDLAIVGLSGRFPGASSIDQYWSNLSQGIESITHFSEQELLDAGVPAHLVADENYVAAAPVLDDAARFDAALFGYSPRDAVTMDPQQRQLLELAWATLEHAGYDPHRYDGRIATYAATAMNTYLLQTGLASQFTDDYLPTLLGSDKDFQATRIAFKLGLTGPALSVQTACSSSLVALHIACQSLLSDECDMALVGAAAVRAPLAVGHLYEEGSVFTPDGHCKPFDAAANGTIFGSGAGMVLVKRLTDAVRDRDTVWAVIRGTAINNDGAGKADYTAPSIGMQADVISEALGKAGVSADTINYVEAHGTGTYLGDPIEVEALTRAFRNDTDQTQFCSIGSVKSNIGHLDVAAGIASLIKVVLAMKHRQLPPTLHFSDPNPQINFEASPFKVVSALTPWVTESDEPRRAGITSLGMGGTNAHAVIEEPDLPNREKPSTDVGPQVLLLSARTDKAVDSALTALAAHCRENPDLPIGDVAFTLERGRQRLGKRRALVASSATELAQVIESKTRGRIVSARVAPTERDVVLMFPGQGAQYPGMGRGLYDTEPVFRDVIDQVTELLQPELKIALRDAIFDHSDDAAKNLAQTAVTQPALYAIEVAYARLLQAWGITPAAMIGHSIGEYAAATIAGVFDLETGARLVAARGRLMQAAPTGSMLAVNLSAEQLTQRLGTDLDLAVVNGVDMAVAAGPDEAINALRHDLESADVGATLLQTSHAFHSAMMESATREFVGIAAQFTLNSPSIPFVSNLSGDWITDEQATDPNYWATHIRSTVKFSDGLRTLFSRGPSVLLEVGPGSTLSSLAQQHPDRGTSHAALSAGRHPNADMSDQTACLGAIGGLWTAGVDIDWSNFLAPDACRVPLPTYAFEGDEHWYRDQARQTTSNSPAVTTLTREVDHGNWFWTDTFQALPSHVLRQSEDSRAILLIGDQTELSAAIDSGLRAQGCATNNQTSVSTGLRDRADFDRILDIVDNDSSRPTDVVYAAPAVLGAADGERVFIELVHLAQSLSRWDGVQNCRLRVIVANAFAPIRAAATDPYAAMLAATLKTISTEWPHISARLIDVDHRADFGADAIANELGAHGKEAVVSLRDDRRWIQTIAPHWLAPAQWPESARSNCVLVGAFGGVGRELALFLAAPGVKLGLLSRQVMPPRSDWQQPNVLENNRDRIELVQELEKRGAQVSLMSADSSDANSIRLALSLYQSEMGSPDYVFHLGGVVDDAPLYSKSDASMSAVLAPKVSGTQYLYDWLVDQSSGHLVLFSSISAVMTPAGQVDYAAANAFQNAFAAENDRVIAIAWPGWRGIGMADRIADVSLREHAQATGVDAADAMQCLSRAIQSGVSSTIVSPVNVLTVQQANNVKLETPATFPVVHTNDPTGGAGNLTADRVAAHWCALLGFEPQSVSNDDSFFDLGGTSLVAVKLFARLEREFGISLPVELLLEAPSISGLSALIDERQPQTPGDNHQSLVSDTIPPTGLDSASAAQQASLVPIRSGATDAPPFYFIHAHGGTVIGYQDVVRRMDRNRAIWGLQSQGIRGDVQPLQTIEEMARHYTAEIRQANPNGPYLLGGYCMGGTIAWEVARQLEADGHEVGLLVMLEAFHRDYPTYRAGVNPVQKKFGPYVDWLRAIWMRDSAGQSKLPFVARTIWSAGLRQVQSGVHIDLENAGGSEALVAVHDTNGQAFWKYYPQPLHAPVLFLSAQHQPMGIVPDASLGYGHLATGWSRQVSVPGSFHNGMVGLNLDLVIQEMQDGITSDKKL